MTPPTDAAWRRLERRIAHWQRILRLTHWEVILDRIPTEANATIWRANDYPRAAVRFNAEWHRNDPAALDVTIVHELLHIVTRDVDFAAALPRDHCTKAVAEIVERSYDHAIEGAIEHLAMAIVALADSTA